MPRYRILLPILFFITSLLNAQSFQRITDGPLTALDQDSYSGSWVDWDADGDQDLLVMNYDSPNQLYLNEAGDFVDILSEIWLPGIVEASLTGSWADWDNDFDLDLFMGQYIQNPDYLLVNEGSFFSMDTTYPAATTEDHSYAGSWGDYDGDGDLDLLTAATGEAYIGRYMENADGQFIDRTAEIGYLHAGYSRSTTWVDVDLDGDLDAYVCRGISWLTQPDLLLIQDDGVLHDEAALRGITHEDYSLGAAWGDYDADGDLDLYVVTAADSSNRFYRNDGGNFVDVTAQYDLAVTAGHSYRASWIDVENDGDLDLFIARNTGETNLLFLNDDAIFLNFTVDAGLADDTGRPTGHAWGDATGDGLPDLFLPDRHGPNSYYVNTSQGGHYLRITLRGLASNSMGIGALIRLYGAGANLPLHVHGGIRGNTGSDDPFLPMGLGSLTILDSVVVDWPSGIHQVRMNVSVDPATDLLMG